MYEFIDKELVARYLRGDESALEILIKRYLVPIYRFAYRWVGTSEIAEDVTQEVFVKVWKSIKKFDKEKNFKTWVYSIAKNTAIDFLKKKSSVSFSSFENVLGKNVLAETLIDEAPMPDMVSNRKSLMDSVRKVAGSLSRKYRDVLAFRYNSDLSFAEIAKITGESIHTVKSRHRRAMSALRGLLSE